MTTLPYSQEAESYVLGSMLWTRKATGKAIELLSADDFIDAKHRILFRTLRNMFIEGQDIDPILVAERLREDGQDGQVARDYIIQLLDDAGASTYLESHAKLILHRSHSRALSRVVQEPHQLSNEEIEDAAQKADDLLRRMRRAEQEPTRRVGERVAEDIESIEAAGQRKERLLGISTGLPSLDDITAGWEPGQLVVVGAQTSHGKTSLKLKFALEAAKAGKRVLFFSLEMGQKAIRERIYAQEANLNLTRVRTGELRQAEWDAITALAPKVSEWPLYLCDKKGLTAGDIAAEARRVAAEGPLDIVVVDYLQFVKADNKKLQRYEQVGEIARALKELAGELGCTVITGAQFSRAIESRTDKRPLKSDLRESGDIEHTADIILLLYWPWKVDPQANKDPNDMELIVAKNRQGAADKIIQLRYVAEQTLHFEAGA